MDLAEKYRPRSLNEVINQEPAVNSLKSLLKRDLKDLPHAFLFSGHHGCGKTTLAYVLRNELRCSEVNTQYYNTSNTRGIDTIREIDQLCRFKPLVAPGEKPIKFYILDEAHQITPAGQEALLAIIERPPEHVYFVLCTTEPDKLITTIRSRCHQYVLQSFSRVKLVGLINEVCKKEQLIFPPDIIRLIADSSDNSARNALKILDAVADIEDDEEVKRAIQISSIDHKEVIDICRIVLDKQYTNWPTLCAMLKSIDAKPDDIRRSILGYLGSVAMNSKTYPRRVIVMLSLFSESVVYGGLGALIAQIGLAFQVEDQ